MNVSELRNLLFGLPADMEVGVESSQDHDALEGHAISSGYKMDFTHENGGAEVFLLQIDRDEDSLARWQADRELDGGPDNEKDEEV